ncbi:PREDICTED: deleted in autism protein 1 homolog isoform X1 [Wasmannia auropunctata]|uniref:deleted in autism protein 1 homolog isoform X1 n=1 Tax=Wasmannia auropunctata TaxID=64793 RepID=UPI0005ED840A|nr:PREDICTED: deleted in autism protein 1 homolog isoform X1 [Wasmannia auropunctata]
MILYYIRNIVRFKKWKILLLIGTCLLASRINGILQSLYPSVTQLTELHKCPACYGVSACHNIHKVDLLWNNVNAIISHLFGVKNVFFGTYNQSKVVLKKLAHSSELKALDVTLCSELQLGYPCSSVPLDGYTADFYDLIRKIITSDFSKDDTSRLRLCPTIGHLDDLFYNVHLNNKLVDPTQYLINLWTLVSINPEPLILQILSAEDGWPVPKYFGACGRIIIEEYVGLPLSDYYDKSWIQRVKIASSLLNAAYLFTFKNESFGFYLTDISADNIAIDHENVAKFIDLENIIIVDKNISQEDEPKEWQKIHKNTMHFDCPDCFAFSAEDICNHHLSDHNYYAICQLLLNLGNENPFPGGFLQDIPTNIEQEYPDIEYLLQQCAVPDSINSRIFFGQQLKALLDMILELSQHEYNIK